MGRENTSPWFVGPEWKSCEYPISWPTPTIGTSCLETGIFRLADRRGWGVGFLAAMGALGSGLAALLYGAVEHLPGEWRALYAFAGVAVLYVAWLRRNLPESPLFEQQAVDLTKTFWQPLREIVTQHRRAIIALLGTVAFARTLAQREQT